MTKDDLKKVNLPDEPGVYLFKKGRKILYIGKAASLRDRVRSYFSADLSEGRSPAIVKMVSDAETVSYEKTDSVLEALILEANLIKQHQPPANVDEKDNKSFNYLVITKEEFPRVVIVRGRELFLKWNKKDVKHLFGPFPGGMSLQEAVKIVRKIFPFRDSKCFPCGSAKNKLCRPCFNRQIGLCSGVCTGEMSKDDYAVVVAHIKELFSGNFKGLKRQLAIEMRELSKSERYEDAVRVRRQIDGLTHIKDVSLIKNDSRVSAGGGVRIEAYDVAHTGGTEPVGVMTVVHSGETVKAAYRKFKIKTATNDDVASLKEILSRRLNHTEWPLPRVFVVDGGKGQMRAAERILKDAGLMIPIVGVVKNEFHKPERLIGDTRAIGAYEKDILLANAEAHRFGIGFHRGLRRKNFSGL
jgi:excinuclease ABC subunit C